ncbi:glucose-6-phosphate isomerase [Chlamydiifrater volucris]|uniref:glucose-6-phosphate isomerase n=1 Tax=Chlamydiifrater volucris TaxID=2681470 RepID=UPI001BCC64B4|nr:glucose-6-phosphate isomerase [Chlamydiifrater volucris]
MKDNEKFLSSRSIPLLHELSKSPFNLNHEGVLTPDRFLRYSMSAAGLFYCYALERIDDSVIENLRNLGEERGIVSQMRSMQSGDVVNVIKGFPSENRPALHTAMRGWVSSEISKEIQSSLAKEMMEKAKREFYKLESFLNSIGNNYSTLVQVGIGGSELGPHALYQALSYPGQKRFVRFVSNVDPDSVTATFSDLDLQSTLVVVVSKSGSTLETATNEMFIRSLFKEANLDPNKHFIAVTNEGSPMDDPKRYLKVFYMWDCVGGRYSATSMVGGVALSFAFGSGIFKEILCGAADMDLNALEGLPKNLPAIAALLGIWNRNFLRYSTVAIIPYSEALLRFPAHLQQCTMESNGKGIDKFGDKVTFQTSPVIWGEAGTNSQHSFFQMIHQGTEIVPVEFIGFRSCRYGKDPFSEGTSSQQKLCANLLAQALALAKGEKSDNPNRQFDGNRPSSLLLADIVDAKTLGALLAFYEHKIVFQGFCWGINSFDQEGVSLGKRLADSFLGKMAGNSQEVPSEVSALLDVFDKQKRL